jgi:hypothetical protein
VKYDIKPLSKNEVRTCAVQDIRVEKLFVPVVISGLVGPSRHRLEPDSCH